LVSDPAQIPVVLGYTLWDKREGSSEEDKFGQQLYEAFFNNVIELLEVKRVEEDDGDSDEPGLTALKFLEILDRIRDGDGTEEDWILVSKVCSRHTMGDAKWKERFGNDDEITYLFTTNKKVDAHNAKMLKKLDRPIALIEAEHTGNSKAMSSSSFMGLHTFLFLSVFAKIVMTSNVCQPAGLCNGATGIVMDIVYEEGQSAPKLPKFVWVNFGAKYKGPSFLPDDESRKGWVPVHPFTATEWTHTSSGGYQEHSRTMLPLRLAWAWTVWKTQGQTLQDKVVCELGTREPEAGITYTAFSRVTKLVNFGIIGGLTFDRFTTKIRNHPKVAGRKLEESRLRASASATVAMLRQKIATRQNA
jgi:hypothetical protein